MAEVTYIDLNKYVIWRWAKWTDPQSGARHRVEYREKKHADPQVDTWAVATLEKWQDDVFVETLSKSVLHARIQKWQYAPEPEIPHDVWRQLGANKSHEVLMQWKLRAGDDVRLMSIRRYGFTYDLFRDDTKIYEGTAQLLEDEEATMNEWLIGRTLHDIHTYRDKLPEEMRAWWGRFEGDGFAFTQDNYDRVRLAIENLRHYYRENGQPCPEALTVDRCKRALDIWLGRLNG